MLLQFYTLCIALSLSIFSTKELCHLAWAWVSQSHEWSTNLHSYEGHNLGLDKEATLDTTTHSLNKTTLI